MRCCFWRHSRRGFRISPSFLAHARLRHDPRYKVFLRKMNLPE
jgi:hypothetical protein